MGRPIYASDVRLPGMLYAAVAACPAHGGRLVGFDSAKASHMPGVRMSWRWETTPSPWWPLLVAGQKGARCASGHLGRGFQQDLSSEAIRQSFLKGLAADDVAIGRRSAMSMPPWRPRARFCTQTMRYLISRIPRWSRRPVPPCHRRRRGGMGPDAERRGHAARGGENARYRSLSRHGA